MRRHEPGFHLSVAYLVNQYPKVSHSFIRREIQALEKQGLQIERFALRGWRDELADEADIEERSKTRYVLQGGLLALLWAICSQLTTVPWRFCQALLMALRLGWRSDRPLMVHFVYLAEACRLTPWLVRSGVRHLHAHFGTNSAEVALLANVLCGISYSFTVHGPEEFDKPEFIGLREKIAGAAFVVAISSYGRSQLFRWARREDWTKIQVVHCGLERAFHAVALPPPPSRPRLVCVGRLCPQKGQLLLIEAAAKLARRGIQFELALAGDGELRSDIEAAIVHHGLEKQVSITGWISGAEVRAEILSSRALVLPSFAEGLPVVVMEAMALRRPVLTTYIAGIPELVISGENGWLVTAGAVDDLAAAMIECLTLPVETLTAMGDCARQRVLLRHDIDREATRLSALFADAMPADTPARLVSV